MELVERLGEEPVDELVKVWCDLDGGPLTGEPVGVGLGHSSFRHCL